MSLPVSAEWLADVQCDARFLVERTNRHKDQVEAFVASAGRDAAAARHVDVSARELHAAACRLLSQIDGDPVPVPGSHTNTVLVVDDYREVREMVARVLRDAGFVVRTAANGLEGLIAAYEMRPGVIVMDVTMPVLGGIEATRLIKAGEATRDARVIAYTGSPLRDDEVVQQLFAAVLEKPAPPHVVLATVQHVASQ